jgi:hypothetical protein
MRKFSSYGPVDPELHYYVPRQALVDFAYQQLLGDNPNKGLHHCLGPPSNGQNLDHA